MLSQAFVPARPSGQQSVRISQVSAAAVQIAEESIASGLAWHFENIRDVSEARQLLSVFGAHDDTFSGSI